MKYFRLFLMVGMLLELSSCVHCQKGADMRPPEYFKLVYTSFFPPGETCITWKNNRLILTGEGPDGKSTKYFYPTSIQWQNFWHAMKESKAASWRSNYDPKDVGLNTSDGGSWKFDAKFYKMTIHAGGVNAGPDPRNVRKTITDFWMKNPLDDALKDLLKQNEK